MRKLGQHDVDRIFEEALGDAQLPVPSNVWAGISSELEKDGLKRKVFWYQRIAAASVLLLMGIGTWTLGLQSGTASLQETALGKPLRDLEHQLPLRECPVLAPTEFVQTSAKGVKPNVATMQPTQQDAFSHMPKPQRTQVNFAVSNVPNSSAEFERTMDQVMAPAMATIEMLKSRRPTGIADLSISSKQQHQSIAGTHVGTFAGILQAKDPEKRREKEFAYVLDSEEDFAKSTKRWEVGAGFAPDMTFASTTPVQQTTGSAKILADDPTKAEIKRLSPVMAYSSGVRAAYELNNRWSVRTGATYSNRQTSTAALATNGKVSASQSTLNLSTLEIPVSMRYNVITNKHFDYYVASGVSANFLLQYDNSQITPTGKVVARRNSDPSDLMRPSQANVLLSTGLRYRILDRLNLQVEPGMRYGVITNEYAFSQSRPISLNLLTGLNYHF